MTGEKKKRPGEPALELEDSGLWRQVAESTRPLPGKTVRGQTPAPAPKPPPAAESKTSMPKPAPPRPAPVLPALEPGHAAGLDRRTAERLRRGQLPIDGRLDLHGWTQGEAHLALGDFIENAAATGLRCLLVITGKGGRTSGEPGVLRAAVPKWLNLPALRPLILGFSGAQPKHGGGGALYVLLKRKR